MWARNWYFTREYFDNWYSMWEYFDNWYPQWEYLWNILYLVTSKISLVLVVGKDQLSHSLPPSILPCPYVLCGCVALCGMHGCWCGGGGCVGGRWVWCVSVCIFLCVFVVWVCVGVGCVCDVWVWCIWMCLMRIIATKGWVRVGLKLLMDNIVCVLYYPWTAKQWHCM